MINSSAMCLRQEAHHLEIAANAVLINVRKIATAAAGAWAKEAIEAQKRESRSKDRLSASDQAIAREFERDDPADMVEEASMA